MTTQAKVQSAKGYSLTFIAVQYRNLFGKAWKMHFRNILVLRSMF